MLEVLERAAADITFYTQLAEKGSAALEGLDLTREEKAALISGDVQFIESCIGRKLDEKLMERVLIPLLSREQW
jgi:hypothetical protein